MTPVFLSVLLLSLAAVHPGATDDGDIPDKSVDAFEKANDGIKKRLIFGDIVPNLNRNAVPCTAKGCKWPKSGGIVEVPVSISSSYSWGERNIITRSLQAFHWSTCIRFVFKRSYHRDYLHFFSGSGCWSYLGRQSGGQSVSLRKNGCLQTTTVQHEVLHALGFHHEQVRSDRDAYVRILTENIQSGRELNFQKVQTNNLGTSYDFHSIMHYSNFAFSKNGKPTILSKKNPDLHFRRAVKMTANDIRRVNRLYQCCE